MGLDNVDINSGMLAWLYGNVLVKNEAAEAPALQNGIMYSGKNEKNIAVFFTTAPGGVLPPAQNDLLLNILKACELEVKDVALINAADNTGNTAEVYTKELKPSLLLFFGLQPSEAGFSFNIPIHKLQPLHNAVYFVTLSPEELLNNNAMKKELWQNLRTYFNK